MTIEEFKKIAKEQCGRDITDEEAKKLFEELHSETAVGELDDERLGEVSGGGKIVDEILKIVSRLG